MELFKKQDKYNGIYAMFGIKTSGIERILYVI